MWKKSGSRTRLEVEMDISPDTLNAIVPNLILQPLVENSIKYAVAPKSSRGIIKIKSRIAGKKLSYYNGR